jgi:hypothetical protein
VGLSAASSKRKVATQFHRRASIGHLALHSAELKVESKNFLHVLIGAQSIHNPPAVNDIEDRLRFSQDFIVRFTKLSQLRSCAAFRKFIERSVGLLPVHSLAPSK